MSDKWVLILLAAVIIVGGYLLNYRSGKHRALKSNEDEEHSRKN